MQSVHIVSVNCHMPSRFFHRDSASSLQNQKPAPAIHPGIAKRSRTFFPTQFPNPNIKPPISFLTFNISASQYLSSTTMSLPGINTPAMFSQWFIVRHRDVDFGPYPPAFHPASGCAWFVRAPTGTPPRGFPTSIRRHSRGWETRRARRSPVTRNGKTRCQPPHPMGNSPGLETDRSRR